MDIRNRVTTTSRNNTPSSKTKGNEQFQFTETTGKTENSSWKVISCVVLLFVLFLLATKGTHQKSLLLFSQNTNPRLTFLSKGLKISTWNVAAINNNPFEYWINYESGSKAADYDFLMEKVQEIIEDPKQKNMDLAVEQVFTEAMFQELIADLKDANIEHLDEVESLWNKDYRKRLIISEFLKDKELGLKRLVSMPDRVTNTMVSEWKKGFSKTVYRPSVINCYPNKIASLEDFWTQWKEFMFRTTINQLSGTTVISSVPVHLLHGISRAKYPAVSELEEKVSHPLQVLILAVFDAILVQVLNSIYAEDVYVWQDIRHEICENLNLKKTTKTLAILKEQYSKQDIIFLQEVGTQLLGSRMSRSLVQFVPKTPSKNNQNSVIYLRRHTFPDATAEFKEVTSDVLAELQGTPQAGMVSNGDLLVIQSSMFRLILASFHGDTNGLATKPVVDVVKNYVDRVNAMEMDDRFKYSLIFGLDANTYEFPKPGKTQGFTDFVEFYRTRSLFSCWDPRIQLSTGGATTLEPSPKNYTTFSARTFLQPQLNKAAKKNEFFAKGDVNPKDFILFSDEHFRVKKVVKDNTGVHKYLENSVFPSFAFPADHAVLSAELTLA